MTQQKPLMLSDVQNYVKGYYLKPMEEAVKREKEKELSTNNYYMFKKFLIWTGIVCYFMHHIALQRYGQDQDALDKCARCKREYEDTGCDDAAYKA